MVAGVARARRAAGLFWMRKPRPAAPTAFRRRDGGYSLVEILAAITITAIVASVAVLSLPNTNDRPTRDHEVFAARVQLAAQEAVISGNVIGLTIDEFGYRFARFRNGRWSAMAGSQAMEPRQWDPDVFVTVELEEGPDLSRLTPDEIEALPPLMRFDPTGGATPFVVLFDMADLTAQVRVDRAAGVVLEVESDENA